MITFLPAVEKLFVAIDLFCCCLLVQAAKKMAVEITKTIFINLEYARPDYKGKHQRQVNTTGYYNGSLYEYGLLM